MIDILDFLRQYATAIIGVGQVFIFAAVLYLRGKFASKKLEDDVDDHIERVAHRFNDMDKRVLMLEERAKDMPTIKDLHKLELQINDLSGDMRRIEESIDGTEGILTRLERQVNRIEDFLKGARS